MKATIWLILTITIVNILQLKAQPKSEQIRAFQNATEALISYNSSTKMPGFIRFPQKKPIQILGSNLEKATQSFVKNYGVQLGIEHFQRDFKLVKSETDRSGFQHLTYQQSKNGVAVYDGQLKFHYDRDNNLSSINGVYLPESKLNTDPSISEKEAQITAINYLSNLMNLLTDGLFINSTDLYIFRKGLIQGVEGIDYLTYRIDVRNDAGLREFIFVDAHNGEIIEQFSGAHSALKRKLYESDLSNLIWQEGNTLANLDVWQKNEVEAAGHIYNLFKNTFGYHSYDNADAEMLTIHNNPNIACPNASWNGTTANYCTGTASDDVVGHEWAHAYTEYTNNLIYAWQAGALNESYSDIWGETIDLLNGYEDIGEDLSPRSGCASSHRWLIGEDATAFGSALRDMWDPTCKGDPGKMSDDEYNCDLGMSDNGGVHTNSGINNHAYALLVDGGSYNGQTINALGFTKTAHIFWRAMSTYLTLTSDFSVQADALESACTDLIGLDLEGLSTTTTPAGPSGEVITIDDLAEVQKAILAVEMRQEPNCPYQPLLASAPPLCAQALRDSALWFEDFEDDLQGWTISSLPSNISTWEERNWHGISSLPAGRDGSGFYAPDPKNGDCQADLQNGILRLESPSIIIPDTVEGDLQMVFDHYVATEPRWDGGHIKYRINSKNWSLLPSYAFTSNPYNTVLYTMKQGNDNPLAGQSAFSGSDGGSVGGSWSSSVINLASLGMDKSDTIQFRWEFGTDGCNGRDGWYLDNLLIFSCGPCVNDLAVNNTWDSEKILFEASSSIISSDNIYGNALIAYNAGQEVQLVEGFEVGLGAILEAQIGGCLSSNNEGVSSLDQSNVSQLGNRVALRFPSNQPKPFSLYVYNNLGQKRPLSHHHEWKQGITEILLETQELLPGTYVCKVITDEENYDFLLAIH